MDDPFSNPIKGKLQSKSKKSKESSSEKRGGLLKMLGFGKKHTQSSTSVERTSSSSDNATTLE